MCGATVSDVRFVLIADMAKLPAQNRKAATQRSSEIRSVVLIRLLLEPSASCASRAQTVWKYDAWLHCGRITGQPGPYELVDAGR